MNIFAIIPEKINSFISYIIFMYILTFIYTIDISSFKINYFKANSLLYYVNAINSDDGSLYIEYWGEQENKRYIMGLNLMIYSINRKKHKSGKIIISEIIIFISLK